MATYRIKSPDGSTYRVNAPDDASEADVMRYVQQNAGNLTPTQTARPQVDTTSPTYQAKLADERAAAQRANDPLNDMSTFEKYAASVGSGAADVILGAKQRWNDLVTKDPKRAAELEQEAADKRTMDARLHASVPGGGIASMVGNVAALAPLALIPGGQGAAASIGLGAGSGAAAGALQPTTKDESALFNTVVGGATGAALPAAVQAWKFGKQYLTQAGTRQVAAQQIANELASQSANMPKGAPTTPRQAAQNVADDVATALRMKQDIPLSTAARIQNNDLAQMELVSRQRNKAAWAPFDEAHYAGIADKVKNSTVEGMQEQALRNARADAFRQGWQNIEQQFDPAVFAQGSAGLRQGVAAARQTGDAVIEGVTPMLDAVTKSMDQAGSQWSPAHVKNLRQNFRAKRLPGSPPSVYQAAPRNAQAVQDTIASLDALLDASSGGAYTPLNQAYKEASKDVRAAEAANAIRNAFWDQNGKALTVARDGPVGAVPSITEAGLNKAMKATTDPWTKGSYLSQDAQQGLQEVMDAIRAQGQIQRLQKTGTAGGGSATAANQIADRATEEVMNAVDKVPVLKHIAGGIKAVKQIGAPRINAAKIQALQDPTVMAQMLSDYAARTAPLTSKQAALASVLRQAQSTYPAVLLESPAKTFNEGAGY